MGYFLMIILVLVLLVFITYLKIRRDFHNILQKYFKTNNFKDVIELSEIENQNTPKSLAGMESVALPQIARDFPELNINELKSEAEKCIIGYLDILENKEMNDNLTNISDKIKLYILSELDENNKKNVDIHFDSIKIHRTVLNKYENKNGIATIYFQTALEYKYKENNGSYKKVQDRFKTEFIYIIDVNKVKGKAKAIGLNCPNCGAPIKNIGHKTCDYCNSGVVDIVKRNWILNNITQY